MKPWWIAGLLACAASAQTFDVASIKVSTGASQRGSQGGPGTSDPGRYSFHSATLLDLIVQGYHVDYFQVSSKTPLEGVQFDLDAKIPPDATREQFRAMLRNLLVERFHLKTHTEKRELSGYELVIAKGGPKLKLSGDRPPTPPNDQFPAIPADRPGMASHHSTSAGYVLVRMIGHKEPLSTFADGLHVDGDRPIVDKTGLTGLYDFVLEYSYPLPGGSAAEPAGLPDLFTALPQQLGLQLAARKVLFDVVVVDAVDKTPTGN